MPKLYIRFRQLIDEAWQSVDYTYNEPTAATLTAPIPGTTLTGPTATFTWSGGVAVTYFELAGL